MNPVPFHRPSLGEAELEGVRQVLESGWITSGQRCVELEAAFAERLGVAHCLAVSSCTAALELGLRAFGIGPDDVVLTTPMTFVATAEVVVRCGATLRFVDVDPEHGCLTPEGIEAALDDDVKAILPVHLGGHPLDLEGLRAAANSVGARLLDDAAHGPGIGVDHGLSDASAFSFYANKNLSCGEGGLLAIRDEELADRARRLRLHGLSRDAWSRLSGPRALNYDVVTWGMKANLPDLLAAILLAQLKRADAMTRRRREIVRRYDEAFAEVDGLGLPARPKGGGHSWHLYIVRWSDGLGGMNRDEAATRLEELGIGTSLHYRPLHRMALFEDRYPDGSFPAAERWGRESLSLPLYPGLADEEVERVIAAVKRLLG